eukprot:CAMPEP_0195297684 /NCGR_PEP_ID=MMETSP0707-20130614/22004_1 /TAXON_ID=33640 /ORGANISM="Asterionellopsis glacialis, Strain CCMP134" /LENGTH=548 /DNA_ID=CAMNT_0040359573 /DNA_START=327 /DNA_END=1973 /DNA_ORIENTATION=+
MTNRRHRDIVAFRAQQPQKQQQQFKRNGKQSPSSYHSTDDGMSELVAPPTRRRRSPTPSPPPSLSSSSSSSPSFINEQQQKSFKKSSLPSSWSQQEEGSQELWTTIAKLPTRSNKAQYSYTKYPQKDQHQINHYSNQEKMPLLPSTAQIPTHTRHMDLDTSTMTMKPQGPNTDNGLVPLVSSSVTTTQNADSSSTRGLSMRLAFLQENSQKVRRRESYSPPPPPRLSLLSSPLPHPPKMLHHYNGELPRPPSIMEDQGVEYQPYVVSFEDKEKRSSSSSPSSSPEEPTFRKKINRCNSILTVRKNEGILTRSGSAYFGTTNRPTFRSRETGKSRLRNNNNNNNIHQNYDTGSQSSHPHFHRLSCVMNINGTKIMDQHIRKLANVLEGGCTNLTLNRRGKCYFYMKSFLLNVEVSTNNNTMFHDRKGQQHSSHDMIQDNNQHKTHPRSPQYCYYTLSTTVHWTGMFQDYHNDLDSSHLIQSVLGHLHSAGQEQKSYYSLQPKGESQICLVCRKLVSPLYDDFRQDINNFVTMANAIKQDIKNVARQAEF